MGDGGHPPGAKFQVKCVGKTGKTLSFMSEEVSIDATFTDQEYVDAITVNQDGTVDFHFPGAGESGGSNQSQT